MDAIDKLLEEADKLARERKAQAKKAGVPLAAIERAERINWKPEAIVAVFQSTICRQCGEVHSHPIPGPLLVRYRNMDKPNEIWESATPNPLLPAGLPEAIRYLTAESNACASCFGHLVEED